MLEYKNEDDPVSQRLQQHCIEHNVVGQENDKKELPEDFFQIEQILTQIIESFHDQDQDRYEKLQKTLLAFSEFIDAFKYFSKDIADFIQNFETSEFFKKFEDETLTTFSDYLISIFYIGKSPILMKNLIILINIIVIDLPFDYYFPIISELDDDLIKMILHPSMGLQEDHGDDFSKIDKRSFNEDTPFVQYCVANILHCFIKKAFENYQENNDEKLYNYCYNCSFYCLVPCSEAIDNLLCLEMKSENLFKFIDFLNFSLQVVFFKHEKNDTYHQFDDMQTYALWTMIAFFSRYVTNPENPYINLCFFNLSKLILLVRIVEISNEDFFSKILDLYMDIEQYRNENHNDLIQFLCSVASSYNDKAILMMMNAFQQVHNRTKSNEKYSEPLMILMSKNSNTEGRKNFCRLCYTLITKCYTQFEISKLLVIFPNIIGIFERQIISQQVGLKNTHKITLDDLDEFVNQLMSLPNPENGSLSLQSEVQNEQAKLMFLRGQLLELKDHLLQIGSNWIDFMYSNDIFYILCDMSINENSYNNKLSSAESLANISPFLPKSILSDLIMNHQFIDIFYQLVGGEKNVYIFVIKALTSVLDLISSMPTNAAAADLYLKIADTNLLYEIEENGKDLEDEKLMQHANAVLERAKIENDRFAAFLHESKS